MWQSSSNLLQSSTDNLQFNCYFNSLTGSTSLEVLKIFDKTFVKFYTNHVANKTSKTIKKHKNLLLKDLKFAFNFDWFAWFFTLSLMCKNIDIILNCNYLESIALLFQLVWGSTFKRTFTRFFSSNFDVNFWNFHWWNIFSFLP